MNGNDHVIKKKKIILYILLIEGEGGIKLN